MEEDVFDVGGVELRLGAKSIEIVNINNGYQVRLIQRRKSNRQKNSCAEVSKSEIMNVILKTLV